MRNQNDVKKSGAFQGFLGRKLDRYCFRAVVEKLMIGSQIAASFVSREIFPKYRRKAGLK